MWRQSTKGWMDPQSGRHWNWERKEVGGPHIHDYVDEPQKHAEWMKPDADACPVALSKSNVQDQKSEWVVSGRGKREVESDWDEHEVSLQGDGKGPH